MASVKVKRKNIIDLTKGSVTRHILRMLGPFSVAVIALISVGIVDAIYLGQLTDQSRPDLGVMALAAIGFAHPLTFLGNSANIGLGAGAISALARSIGQGEEMRAKRHGAAAVLLALLVMVLLASLMWLSMPFVLPMMGAEGEIQSMTRAYLNLSLPSLVIVAVAMICNNCLRARGEAFLPSLIMISGAMINIILDPFLIFGWGIFPRLEIVGAALATLIGHMFAAVLGLYLTFIHRHAMTFSGMTFHSILRAWRLIGQVALPAAGTNIIVPLGTALAVTIIAHFLTVSDVAAFTIASRAELLSVGLLYALSACIGAITGQNGGAGLTHRVRHTFKACYIICLVWGSFMAMVLAIYGPAIAQLFTHDSDVAARALPYFYIVPVTIFAYGIVFVSAAGFNALGRPGYGLCFTIIRSLVLYILCLYIGVLWDGLRGGFLGLAVANLLSGIIALFWSLRFAPMSVRQS